MKIVMLNGQNMFMMMGMMHQKGWNSSLVETAYWKETMECIIPMIDKNIKNEQ